jgi:hypothetical protein
MKKHLLSLLLLLPSTTLAQEYLKQFPLRQQARYFDFHFKRNPGRVAAIARFADGFVKVVNRDFSRPTSIIRSVSWCWKTGRRSRSFSAASFA